MLTPIHKIKVGDTIIHPHKYVLWGLPQNQTQWAIEVTAIEKAEDGIFDVDYREVSDPSEGHYLVLEADECVHVLTRN